jgi:hypothetical protein
VVAGFTCAGVSAGFTGAGVVAGPFPGVAAGFVDLTDALGRAGATTVAPGFAGEATGAAVGLSPEPGVGSAGTRVLLVASGSGVASTLVASGSGVAAVGTTVVGEGFGAGVLSSANAADRPPIASTVTVPAVMARPRVENRIEVLLHG